ncbi:MAG: type II toxin-antitoxin system death-on-curing family toxin [Verrucomicrobiaceae bacterium]|nr:MAG: type II toxin-antitoxin system death-on-curing family toxin [Verrucomicrobiaceae bacterium]
MQIERFGGAGAVLDLGLLESALAHPKNAFLYGDDSTSLFDLAASYAYHVAKNHPFQDGNKRVGANGWLITQEFTNEMLALVVDDMSKAQFAAHLQSISRRKVSRLLIDSLLWVRRVAERSFNRAQVRKSKERPE